MSRSALYSPQKEKGLGVLGSVIMAAGIVVSGFLLSTAIREFRQFDQFIEVRGLAEEIVKSDQASWNMSFSSYGDSPAAASKAWAEKIDKLEGVIIGLGLEAANIRRTPLTVYENTNPNGSAVESSKRWRAQGGITVETKKVELVEQASLKTDTFVNAGIVLESSYIQFYFTELNSIKPQMLKAATENAKEAAQTFAADSGVTVGALKNATQGLFTISAPLGEYGGENTVMKKVRVVTKVQYLVK